MSSSSSSSSSSSTSVPAWDVGVFCFARPPNCFKTGALLVRKDSAEFHVAETEDALSEFLATLQVDRFVLAYVRTPQELKTFGAEVPCLELSAPVYANHNVEHIRLAIQCPIPSIDIPIKLVSYAGAAAAPAVRSDDEFSVSKSTFQYVERVFESWYDSRLSSEEGRRYWRWMFTEANASWTSRSFGALRAADLSDMMDHVRHDDKKYHLARNAWNETSKIFGILRLFSAVDALTKKNVVAANESALKRASKIVNDTILMMNIVAKYHRALHETGFAQRFEKTQSLKWPTRDVADALESLSIIRASVPDGRMCPMAHENWDTEYNETKRSLKKKRDAFGKYSTDVARRERMESAKPGSFATDCADQWAHVGPEISKLEKRLEELRALAAREWTQRLRTIQNVVSFLRRDSVYEFWRVIALHDIFWALADGSKAWTLTPERDPTSTPATSNAKWRRTITGYEKTTQMRRLAARLIAHVWGFPTPHGHFPASLTSSMIETASGIDTFRGTSYSKKRDDLGQFLDDSKNVKKVLILDDWWPQETSKRADESKVQFLVVVADSPSRVE